MQLQSHLMRSGAQIQKKPAKLNHQQKQLTILASSDCDALIGSAELVHPVQINYEKGR